MRQADKGRSFGADAKEPWPATPAGSQRLRAIHLPAELMLPEGDAHSRTQETGCQRGRRVGGGHVPALLTMLMTVTAKSPDMADSVAMMRAAGGGEPTWASWVTETLNGGGDVRVCWSKMSTLRS